MHTAISACGKSQLSGYLEIGYVLLSSLLSFSAYPQSRCAGKTHLNLRDNLNVDCGGTPIIPNNVICNGT